MLDECPHSVQRENAAMNLAGGWAKHVLQDATTMAMLQRKSGAGFLGGYDSPAYSVTGYSSPLCNTVQFL
jgi:hypothetical protein